MRSIIKSNRIIAICLCIVIVLTGVGIGMAREQRGETYHAAPLTMLAGQITYDLLADVSYDASAYELSVYDLGGFDAARPGTYELTYALTPLRAEVVAPPEVPEVPAQTLPSTDVPATTLPAETVTPEITATPAAPETETANKLVSTAVKDALPPTDSAEADPAPAAPEATEPTPAAPEATEPAPAAPEATEPAPARETLYFTRTVLVTAAAEYENARLNLGDTADLLADITYDKALYTLALTDDGGLDSETVGEYLLTYTLSTKADGAALCHFTRYAHVTLPGVTFEAPDMTVNLRATEYNLTDGIVYDAARYTLAVLDEGDFDSHVEGTQRVLFFLTEKTAVTQDEGQAAANAADKTAPALPMAAVFGRDVLVITSHTIVFNAPPLVITIGESTDVNLLDGVTATDETGETVSPTIKDRTQLDDITPENNAEDAPQRANNWSNAAPVAQMAPSAQLTDLPDTLEPGDYAVTLAATHPVTGEEFTVNRQISVLAANVQIGTQGVARNIGTSGQYYIDVSQNPEPLNITGAIVTVYLSGTGTMQFDKISGNAINIGPTTRALLVLESGATVTVGGRNWSGYRSLGEIPGYTGSAAIHVPAGASLHVMGSGKLIAHGGAAGSTKEPYKAGGGASAAIGGNGGKGGDGWGDVRQSPGDPGKAGSAGALYFYTSNIQAYGGEVLPIDSVAENYSGSGFPAPGIGGGGSGGGGSGSTVGKYPSITSGGGGGGGWVGGLGTVAASPGPNDKFTGKNGTGFLAGSLGGAGGATYVGSSFGSYGGPGGPAGTFGGIALMQNGGNMSSPKATYDATALTTLKAAYPNFPGVADNTSPYFGMGAGIGRKDTMDVNGNVTTVANPVDILNGIPANTYSTAMNPAPPTRLSVTPPAGSNGFVLEWNAANAPGNGWNPATGYEVTGYEVKFYSDNILTATSIPKKTVMVEIDKLTPLGEGRYGYEVAISDMSGQWITVSTVIAPNGGGATLKSIENSIGVQAVMVCYPNDTIVRYPTMAAALTAVTGKSGAHRIVFATPYVMTAEDHVALKAFNTRSCEITIDGRVWDVENNKPVEGENAAVFDLTINAPLEFSTATYSDTTPFIIQHIGLNSDNPIHILARGRYLTMGEGLTMRGAVTVTGASSITDRTNLTVSSGRYAKIAGGGGSNTTVQAITIGGDVEVAEMLTFDTLTIAEGKTLTVTKKMDAIVNRPERKGNIVFAENATLAFTDPMQYHEAGLLVPQAPGAKIIFALDEDTGLSGALLLKSTTATITPANRITLSYGAGVLGRAGNLLIQQTGGKVTSYINGFAGPFGLTESGGKIYLSSAPVRLRIPGEPEAPRYYVTLAEAIDEIRTLNTPTQLPGDYQIALTSKYTQTVADNAALAKLTNLSLDTTIEITGRVETDDLPENDNILYFSKFGGNPQLLKLPLGSAGVKGATFRFTNIKIQGPLESTGQPAWIAYRIIANGSPLIMGAGVVVMDGGSGFYILGADEVTALAQFAGNTSITIDSGSYGYVAGGGSGTAVQGIQQGTTSVTINGGSFRDVIAGSYSVRPQTGAATTTINSGGAVPVVISNGLYCGNYSGTMQFKSTLTVNGAVDGVTNKIQLISGNNGTGGATMTGKSYITINGTVAGVASVTDFDLLEISDGATLTTPDLRSLVARKSYKPEGVLQMNGNAALSLTGVQQIIGAFDIRGTNNVLTLPRGITPALLTVNGAAANAGGGKLTLKYRDNTTVAAGDKLVQFTPSATNAKASDYLAGFVPATSLIITADAETGLVSLMEPSIRVTNPAQVVTYYATMGDAFTAIKAENPAGDPKIGEYEIALLKNYEFTAADQTALTAMTGLSNDATIKITGKIESDEKVKRLKYQFAEYITFPVKTTAPLTTGAAYLFENVILDDGMQIAAAGNKLVMGKGIETRAGVSVIGSAGRNELSMDDMNIDMEILSGTYGSIYSSIIRETIRGNVNIVVGGTATVDIFGGGDVSTVIGDITLTVRDQANIKYELIGNFPEIPSRSGNTTIRIEGGTVKSVIGATGNIGEKYNGAVRIHLNGGTITDSIIAMSGNIACSAIVEVNADTTVSNNVSGFDELRIKAAKTLTAGSVEGFQTGGVLLMYDKSTLRLTHDSYSAVGQLITAGSGAVLNIKRPYYMHLTGSFPTDTKAGKLTLGYIDNVAPVAGDNVLFFKNVKQNAIAEDYIWNSDSMTLLDNKTTGFVYLGYTVSMSGGGEPERQYGSLKTAMEAINTRTGEFIVTFRNQNYTITPADTAALEANGKNATKITYTSKFTTQAGDSLEPGEAIGQQVTRTVKLAEDLTFPSVTSLSTIKLDYAVAGKVIYASGHALTTDKTTEIVSEFYPTLYGGNKKKPSAGTALTLNGGKFAAIYGGGNEAAATVNGDTTIAFGGVTELYGPMYGGGNAGGVMGNTSVIATAGTAHNAPDGTPPLVVAGGRTGNVTGNASVDIQGGTVPNSINFAGSDQGRVVGNVTLSVQGHPTNPAKAEKANLYGGGFAGGTVGGTATININNGKDYGIISGGGNPAHSWGASTALASVTGDKIINLTGTVADTNIQAEQVLAFTALNLLHPSGAVGNKTTATITQMLDSLGGRLNFFGGSVLNLPAVSGLQVGSIATDTSSTTSHLHIGKLDETTYPLYIQGKNESNPESRLVLGLSSGDGVRGDRMLVFADKANALVASYLSHPNDPGIIISRTALNEVILGASSFPQVKLIRVAQTEAADLGDTVVNKTLTFSITNDNEAGENIGAIQSGYVSATHISDPLWETTGAMPAGASEITITKDTTQPLAIVWSGTVNMDMQQPAPGNPIYYFAHVRNENGERRVVPLDVNSPVHAKEVAVEKSSMGDYSFAITLKDLLPDRPEGIPDTLIYAATGIYQVGWSVGTDPTTEALTYPMTTAGAKALKGVTDVKTADVNSSYDMKFTVPARDYPDGFVGQTVHLYVKDTVGNTRVIPLPMDDHLIDVTIPLRAGTIAIKGGNEPRLLSPTCYLVNNSPKAITAYVTTVEVSSGNPLTLVGTKGTYTDSEINLQIAPVMDGLTEHFTTTSILSITPTTQLMLGTMPKKSAANHGASFRFTAGYNHKTIKETGAWSYFALHYRFVPVVPLTPIAP